MRTTAIVGALCLIAGLVLGGILGTWLEGRSNDEHTAAAVEQVQARVDRLEAEAAELQHRSTLREMHLRLGRIAIEADHQDYGTAGDRAALFFDDLARIAAEMSADDPDREALRHVLAARDEVIAGLATAQPAAAQTLEQLYLDTFTIAQSSAPQQME